MIFIVKIWLKLLINQEFIKIFYSGASGNAGEEAKTKRAGDATMKEMLSTLVQEANFLVEDNLNLLVEDDEFNEAERNLFKLDSILTAIGVEGEEEVMNVLKKHEASQTSSLDGVRDSIMKIIRTHIEQNRRRISGTGDMLLTDEKRTSKLYRPSEGHVSVKSGLVFNFNYSKAKVNSV